MSNPAHRRSGLVHLAAYGKALLSEATLMQAETMGNLASELSPGDLNVTMHVLGRLQAWVEASRTGSKAQTGREGANRKNPVTPEHPDLDGAPADREHESTPTADTQPETADEQTDLPISLL